MLLKLENLQAKDLVDTGTIMDVQDPALYFTINGHQFNTVRAHNAGLSAFYTENFEIQIDSQQYNDGKVELEVEVFNKGPDDPKNAKSKKLIHIGKGKINLKTALKNEETAELTIDLTHFGKSEIRKGQVILKATLTEDPPLSPPRGSSKLERNSEYSKSGQEETKDDVLISIFGDVGELKEDFHCALQTNLIRHGRIYVTSKYICFLSKLFGRQTKIRIPFDHIQSINKVAADKIGVIHYVIIETGDKSYKFHSFWELEHAFRTMNAAFEEYHQRPRSETTDTVKTVEDDETGEKVEPESEASAPEQLQTELQKLKQKNLVLADQTLPISVQTFYQLFLEDTAVHSYKLYHESVKDTEVKATNWSEVGPNEYTREIKFFKPVNLPGLASTRGVKLQRLKRFGTAGLILSSSTRLEDVPAADCFAVDDTLAIRSTGPNSVAVDITFQVTFLKSTFLKSMIEGPTNREMKIWLNNFFKHFDAKSKAFANGEVPTSAAADDKAPAASTATTDAPAAVQASTDSIPGGGNGGGGGGILQRINGFLPILFLILLFLVYRQLVATNAKLARVESLLAEYLKNQGK